MNQNYFSLDQQQTSNKRKYMRIATLSLLIFGMVGTVLYLTQSNNNSDLIIDNMFYLNSASNDVVISSARNMTVCSSQGGSGIPDTHQQCTLYQSTQDILAQNIGDNKINVYIIYRDLKSSTDFDTAGNILPDPSSYTPLQETEFDLIFKATLTTDGTLLNLEQPSGNVFPDIVIRLTERLIEQHFPQLSNSLFPQQSLLKTAFTPAVNTEDTYLGIVNPSFSFQVLSNDHYSISKKYTEEDFVRFDYSLGGKIPEIHYETEYIIQSGQVHHNREVMHFNISSTNYLLRDDGSSIPLNNSTEYKELIGESQSKVESNLSLISVGQNATLIQEIVEYESLGIFVSVDLDQTNGKIEILSGQKNSTLLSDGTPIIQKKYDVFRHSVMGNTVSLSIQYQNFESYSIIDSGLFLNNKEVFTIYQYRIEHPWFACSDYSKGDNQVQKLKIFEVVYPLLGGILNIPVSAYVELDYGWNFTVGANGVDCNIEFKPYAKPTFDVEGAIQVWKVAQGGVYAKGSVANSYIDFLLTINRQALQLLFTVDAKLIPFEYNIGAFYQYITCSLRKIIKNIFKFKWGEVCDMSQRNEITLLQGQLLETLTYNLHRETKPILSPQ